MCQKNNQEQFIDVETSTDMMDELKHLINVIIKKHNSYIETIKLSSKTLFGIESDILRHQNDNQLNPTTIRKQLENLRKFINREEAKQQHLFGLCQDIAESLGNVLQQEGSIRNINGQLK